MPAKLTQALVTRYAKYRALKNLIDKGKQPIARNGIYIERESEQAARGSSRKRALH